MNIRLFVIVLVIGGIVQAVVLGEDPEFTLTGNDYLAVTIAYSQGELYDDSSTDIQPSGSITQVSAYDNSSVTLSGGSVGQLSVYDNTSIMFSNGSANQISTSDSSDITIFDGSINELYADDTSSVQLFDGSVVSLFAGDSVTVNIFGGTVMDYLGAWGSSELELTGGAIVYLDAGGISQTTFYGYGWSVTGGLSIVDNQLFGTGMLSGFWEDGTSWNTEIGWNADTATITLVQVPEPSMIFLMTIGASMVVRMRSR